MNPDDPFGASPNPLGAAPDAASPLGPDGAARQTAARCLLHPEQGSTATCSHCGNFGCDDCLGYLAGQLVCRTCVEDERVTSYPNPPWEHRQTLGLWPALWATVREATLRPGAYFASIDPQGSAGDPLLLTLAVNVIGALIFGLGIGLLALGGAGFLAAGSGVGEAGIVAGIGVVYAVVIAVMAPIQNLIFALIVGLVAHGMLKLLGGGQRGLNATLRATLYAQAVVFWNVTICGFWVTSLWALVLTIIGCSKLHDEPAGKAAAAILLPLGVCCGGYLGLSVLLAIADA
jgi:hypothetical protein